LSEKSQRLADLLAKVPAPEIPFPALEGKGLLEIAFLCVLQRRLSESAAEKTLAAFSAAFPDWNELRVCQVQEFQHLVQTKSPELAVQVARDAREFLQEIYQKIHGFNLDALKGDLPEAARFAAHLPFLGTSIGHYLLHLACPDELPVSPAIVRTLDRMGFAKRTSSIKKAQAGIESFVPAGLRRDFAIKMGLVVEKWCDAKRPLCWSCPLVGSCPFGKKTEREHKQLQKRQEVQRVRDEERQKKEQEKERKRAAAEEKRKLVLKAKDDSRKAREADKQKAREQAKKQAALQARKKTAPKKSLHKQATAGAKKKK
jgi:endonuclease III